MTRSMLDALNVIDKTKINESKERVKNKRQEMFELLSQVFIFVTCAANNFEEANNQKFSKKKTKQRIQDHSKKISVPFAVLEFDNHFSSPLYIQTILRLLK